MNPQATEVSLEIQLKGIASLAGRGTAITLSGCPEDTNSIQHPRNVIPVTSTIRGVKPDFSYILPPNSIVVLS